MGIANVRRKDGYYATTTTVLLLLILCLPVQMQVTSVTGWRDMSSLFNTTTTTATAHTTKTVYVDASCQCERVERHIIGVH